MRQPCWYRLASWRQFAVSNWTEFTLASAKAESVKARGRSTSKAVPSRVSGYACFETLDLTDTGTCEVKELATLANLKSLWLDGTGVNDLGPLKYLPNLEFLSLERTPVSTLSPLSKLTSLQHVDLTGTRVTDLSLLMGMTNLKSIYIHREPLGRKTPLADLTRPRLLVLRDPSEWWPVCPRPALLKSRGLVPKNNGSAAEQGGD